jgi:hypothetical protein
MQRTQNPVSSAPVEPTPADQPTGPCWSGFCIASVCDGVHHVDATGYTWTEPRPTAPATPGIVAVWSTTGDEPAGTFTFTPDGYAEWHEANLLSDTYSYPTHFYGVHRIGRLISLGHTVEVSDYDADDYAIVRHTWTRWSDPNDIYATGVARRDGRA